MQFRSTIRHPRIQAGFSVIELVSVIVLLGILTVVALPRFINVSEQAQHRLYEATAASLTASVSMFHLLWEVQGRPGAGTRLPGFGTATGVLKTGNTGFPAGGVSGDGLLNNDADCVAIFNALLQAGHATIRIGISPFGVPPAAEVDAYTTDFATRYGNLGFGLGCGYMFVGGGSAFNGGAMPTIFLSRDGIIELRDIAL